ncbi:MAG TPA: hypothetical protein VGW78_02030 [Candidatus Babeliales bacterium]|jgi:hypothetical protein|nr:hypothetical protein [Candidatus Babeliales bacterium]
MKQHDILIGIILRTDQQKQNVTILDSIQGKNILLYPHYIPICSHILYSISGKGGISRLVIQELCHVPLAVSVEDLAFLHQVMELCDKMPIGSSIPEVYTIVHWLCINVPLMLNAVCKDIILMKLCMLFGSHGPHQPAICHECIYHIHATPINTLNNINLHVECLTGLQIWIHYCLEEFKLVTNTTKISKKL